MITIIEIRHQLSHSCVVKLPFDNYDEYHTSNKKSDDERNTCMHILKRKNYFFIICTVYLVNSGKRFVLAMSQKRIMDRFEK